MTHDQILEVIQAHKDGKKCEFRRLGHAKHLEYGQGVAVPPGEWNDLNDDLTGFDFSKYQYQVKPEPKKRFIRTNELPDIFWVKEKDDSECHLATSIYRIGFICKIGDYTVREAIEKNLRYSDSRQGPWKSFEVSE